MNKFESICQELLTLIKEWGKKLLTLPVNVITERRNSQNRTIKQITGHMVDSASNNTHRIIHLQYQESPLIFPDYANFGNNDRWIAIQNYQEKEWNSLVQLWKYTNLHIVHVIQNINTEKLGNIWISGLNEKISLEVMVVDYLQHFKLHLDEIKKLINRE